MSLRYNTPSGSEIILAGLTPGGDIEAGAVMTRSGTASISSTAGAWGQTTVIFTDPMPDADYVVNIEVVNQTSGSIETPITVSSKTKNGFVASVYGGATIVILQFNYTAFKIYDVQHAAQNAEDIETIKSKIPANASSSNKMATASDLTAAENAIDARLDTLEDMVPADASLSNQLVSHDTLDAGLNLKQNALTFDTVPSLNSTNPVTSAGIRAAINAADRSSTIDKLDACYYNVRFAGTTIEDDLVTLLNTFKAKENGTYYGDFIRIGKNAGTYNLSKYSDTTNTFIIGIATSGSQSWSIGVLNNNTPSILKICYATIPTVSAVAPFRIIKNNRCVEVSTMDGSSISDTPLTAYTWETNVRALGIIDSKMGDSLYVMAPTIYQSGNNFYNGVARIFYSGRVDFWCTESISGSYIPYLNVTLPITE